MTTFETSEKDTTLFDSYGNPGVSYTLFDLEKKLIESINRFYVKYAEYTRCSNTNYIPSNCSEQSQEEVTDAYKEAVFNSEVFKQASRSDGKQTYAESYCDLLKKYKTLVETRQKIKASEARESFQGSLHQSEAMYNSSVYSSLMWSILATSLVYFIFSNV
jgi:hypothetical protein